MRFYSHCRSCFLYLFMQSEMEILTEAKETWGREPVKTPGLREMRESV